MLDDRMAIFRQRVWSATATAGMNAGRIVDEIIADLFPETTDSARREGCDRMFRNGVLASVKALLKNSVSPEAQLDFAAISDDFASIVKKLHSQTYWVEAIEAHIPVPQLIAQPELLDDARRFMRRKGEECLAEADRLDDLYAAVTGAK